MGFSKRWKDGRNKEAEAHRSLDATVQKLYGFPVTADFTEAHCVAALMEMYQDIVER